MVVINKYYLKNYSKIMGGDNQKGQKVNFIDIIFNLY